MRTTLRTLTLAASAALAGVGLLGDRKAQAQNGTYADFPYQQGSLGYNYYRHQAKSTTPTYSGWGQGQGQGLFGRRRPVYRYPTPPAQVYRPAARVYAPQYVPATPYYQYPTR